MENNVVQHSYHVDVKKRNLQHKHASFLVWFTGLSGSGKSTIANLLEFQLFQRGHSTYSLDGDNIRSGLNYDLGFSREDREENIRRIAEVGKLFVDAGLITVAAFVSPLKSDRSLVRKIVGEHNFLEVYIKTSVQVCEKRDVKGLYAKARAGEISNFTGINAPYEAPENPDIEIDTEKEGLDDCVQKIINKLESKFILHE